MQRSARRLDNPPLSQGADAVSRHRLDSLNTSNDLLKNKIKNKQKERNLESLQGAALGDQSQNSVLDSNMLVG